MSLNFIRTVLISWIIGSILGGICYFFSQNSTGIFLFEIFSILGLALGIFRAAFVSRKTKDTDYSQFENKNNEHPSIEK
ncbi:MULTISPECIES: hypothetical protein [Amniculibacterium]|uniref:hypothetical protein n=1 Tax=Amniculibacterium TaxID=2715289 RepID=UPI000F5B3035|nr:MULTISPECIES: hypothetical protein [Amniculibacterium]